ncbi:MAG: hypothetical protein RJA20_2805 [Bacteroidota bacterium]|jgi:hypothetical protein
MTTYKIMFFDKVVKKNALLFRLARKLWNSVRRTRKIKIA